MGMRDRSCMDKLLYISMSGAKERFIGMALRGHNLANANTTGFKADLAQARAMQAFGEGLPTRVFSLTERPGHNFQMGALVTTGRDLDVAVQNQGWLTVQDDTGEEALTRFGQLNFRPDGTLQTVTGRSILDAGGAPIVLPLPIDRVSITNDGIVYAWPQGAPANAGEEIAQLKLVNPQLDDIFKGEDGMFRRKDGNVEPFDPLVRLESGAYESSNVNPVEEMTHLINLQRSFELQVKMMKTSEENARNHDQLLRAT